MIKDESMTVLLHHRTTKIEKLVVRIMGTGLKLDVQPTSRVEVTLLRRWEPPELLVSGDVYPWKTQTVSIANDVEKYRSITITGQQGETFIFKNISPLGMMHDSQNTTWYMNVEGNIKLVWGGPGHKTLQITVDDGFQVLSIYGQR